VASVEEPLGRQAFKIEILQGEHLPFGKRLLIIIAKKMQDAMNDDGAEFNREVSLELLGVIGDALQAEVYFTFDWLAWFVEIETNGIGESFFVKILAFEFAQEGIVGGDDRNFFEELFFVIGKVAYQSFDGRAEEHDRGKIVGDFNQGHGQLSFFSGLKNSS
jgi:hypothetical protein